MEGSCPICFEELAGLKLSKIEGCTHLFCSPCLAEWLAVKTSCPLCNVVVTKLLTSNESEWAEQIIPSQKNTLKDSDMSSDFNCLDHSYFMDEVERLTSAARLAQQKLNARSMKLRSNFSLLELRGVKALEYSLDELIQYKDIFYSFERYDPYQVLVNLSQIEQKIQLVNGLKYHKLDEVEVEVKQRRYGADDYLEEWSEEEEEDYYVHSLPDKTRAIPIKKSYSPNNKMAHNGKQASKSSSSYGEEEDEEAEEEKEQEWPLPPNEEDAIISTLTSVIVSSSCPISRTSPNNTTTISGGNKTSSLSSSKKQKQKKKTSWQPLFEPVENKNVGKKNFHLSKSENFQRISK